MSHVTVTKWQVYPTRLVNVCSYIAAVRFVSERPGDQSDRWTDQAPVAEPGQVDTRLHPNAGERVARAHAAGADV